MGNRSYLTLHSENKSSEFENLSLTFGSNNFLPLAWHSLLNREAIQALHDRLAKYEDPVEEASEEDWVIRIPFAQAMAHAKHVVPAAIKKYDKIAPALADFLLQLNDAAQAIVQARQMPILSFYYQEDFGFTGELNAFIDGLLELLDFWQPLNTSLDEFMHGAPSTWDAFDTWHFYGESSGKHHVTNPISTVQRLIESDKENLKKEELAKKADVNSDATTNRKIYTFYAKHENILTWVSPVILIGVWYLIRHLTASTLIASVLVAIIFIYELVWLWRSGPKVSMVESKARSIYHAKMKEKYWLNLDPICRGKVDVTWNENGFTAESWEHIASVHISWSDVEDVGYEFDDGPIDGMLIWRVSFKDGFACPIGDPTDTHMWMNFGPKDNPARVVPSLQIMALLHNPISQSSKTMAS